MLTIELDILNYGKPGILKGNLVDMDEGKNPDAEPMTSEGILNSIKTIHKRENELVDGKIVNVDHKRFFVDMDNRLNTCTKIDHEDGNKRFESIMVQDYGIEKCPYPKFHQILYRFSDNMGYLWTDEKLIFKSSLPKSHIKNGNLVHWKEKDSYHILSGVMLANNKRSDENSRGKDELGYDMTNILTGEVYPDICEHSGMTSQFLFPATAKDVNVYLLGKEADALTELSAAKKRYSVIEKAINEFEKHINAASKNN